ncbi:MAG: DNA helicase RecQ [Elusimicrobiota bacterium]|jgi:ATP-dependent DNA helicase RecQ|nr:DNA helicase RecQ [Elusimicrobiota bacterium]
MKENLSEKKLNILKNYFGHRAFRAHQEELIDAVLNGQDVLGIMPTGAGKSICFQLPALIFDGVAIVISPLISLMKDQTNALTQNGIKSAYINSSLTAAQFREIMSNAHRGEYKLIYIAPERLDFEGFLSFVSKVKVSMMVIDEAHCVSHWGQDFRPSYTKIADFIDSITVRPPVCAFTATATPRVKEDIVEMLRLKTPKITVADFDRPNLRFEVRHPQKKFKELLTILKDKKDKSGIIYCLTRKNVEKVSEKLNQEGYRAAPYHAGLSAKERHKNQDDFIFDRVNIIAATNAFGMGIDKSNVSFVIHYNMPQDLESYYQEAGRAGRDGSPSDCIILYNAQDIRTNLFLIDNDNEKEYQNPQEAARLKELRRKRLSEMDLYCNTTNCLRAYILNYFGQEVKNYKCPNCGNCNAETITEDITILAQKILSCVYRVNENYGKNLVIDILRGAKSEKIVNLSFDKLTTYNICKESKEKLKETINFLILNNFLSLTHTEYPVLKLGARSQEILKDRIKLEMKCSIRQEPQEEIETKSGQSGQHKDKSAVLAAKNSKLYAALKQLRQDLSAQQNIPAYIVFHDSALIDMCKKLPQNKEDFSKVSGVGASKLDRYGEVFIKTIKEFV